MATSKRKPTNQARRALAAHRRALAQLIELLKDPDEEVRRDAFDALIEIDPPPVTQLFAAFRECDDMSFRLTVLVLLEQMAPGARGHVSIGLMRLLRGELAPEVREAVLQSAALIRNGFSATPSSSPAQS